MEPRITTIAVPRRLARTGQAPLRGVNPCQPAQPSSSWTASICPASTRCAAMHRVSAHAFAVIAEGGQDWTDAVLAAIDETTAIVRAPQMRWIDGAWLDLDRIARRVHDLDAALVVDASQSLEPSRSIWPRCGRTSSSASATSGCSDRSAAACCGSRPSIGRPAARGELDRPQGRRAVRPPHRLSRRASAQGTAQRPRRTNLVRAHPNGHRGPRADPSVAARASPRRWPQ